MTSAAALVGFRTLRAFSLPRPTRLLPLLVSAGAHVLLLALPGGVAPAKPLASEQVVELEILESRAPRLAPPPAPVEIVEPRSAHRQARVHRASDRGPVLAVRATPVERPEPIPPALVGVSPSTISEAGTFSAPVGETLLGAMPPISTPAAPAGSGSVVSASPPTTHEAPVVDRQFAVRYPADAARAGVSGRVKLEVAIDATGAVSAVRVVQGLGYGLDEAAMSAMWHFRFKPARDNGVPVPAEISYIYRFVLQGRT